MADNESKIGPVFMPERYRWLKNHLEIDLLSLDEEVTQMPVLLQEVGEICSLAIEIRDTARDERDVAYAAAAELVRQGEKKSNDRVADEATLNEGYQRKTKELEEARLDAALWQALSSSMQNKSYSLNLVTQLLVAGFISKDYALDKSRARLRRGEQK